MWLQTLLFWIFSKSVSNLKVWTSTVQKNKMQALSAQHCQTHFSVTMVESSLELAVCGAKGGFSVKSIRLWQHKREDGSARQCVCVCVRTMWRTWSVFSTACFLYNCVLCASSLEDFVTLPSARIPAGIPVDWIGLAGWLAGSEYQWSLSGIAGLSLRLSGNTSTQLHVSDWRFAPANRSVCMK